jgi:hypothetical protein
VSPTAQKSRYPRSFSSFQPANSGRRLTAEEVQRGKRLMREGMASHLARAQVLSSVCTKKRAGTPSGIPGITPASSR